MGSTNDLFRDGASFEVEDMTWIGPSPGKSQQSGFNPSKWLDAQWMRSGCAADAQRMHSGRAALRLCG